MTGDGTMCDNDSLEDMIEYRLRSAGLSRRQFGALTLGASVVSLLPPVADAAAEVQETEVDIKTPTAPRMLTSYIRPRAHMPAC